MNNSDMLKSPYPDDVEYKISQNKKKKIVYLIFLVGLLAIPVAFLLISRAFDLSILPDEVRNQVKLTREEGIFLSSGTKILLFSDTAVLQLKAEGYQAETIDFGKDRARSLIDVVLEPLPGIVDITVNSASEFRISVDGNRLDPDKLTALELNQGTHTVTVTGERINPISEQIEVTGYGERQSFTYDTLAAQSGFAVSARPESVLLILDGMEIGHGAYSGAISTGKHEIRFKAEGYRDSTRTFRVEVDEVFDLGVVELVPNPATLLIRTTPGDAALFLNSTFVGNSGSKFEIAPDRSHQLSIRKSNFEDLNVQVRMKPGEVAEKSFVLEKTAISAAVRADRVANVQLNGKSLGTTPLTLTVHVGDRIDVTKDGFQSRFVVVDKVGGTARNYTFKMLTPREFAYENAATERVVRGNLTMRKFPPLAFDMTPTGKVEGLASPEKISVKLTRPFYMGIHEVSHADFAAYDSTSNPDNKPPDTPVTRVSWTEAVKFCNWLSKQENLEPVYEFGSSGLVQSVNKASLGYRLPTEMEWEASISFDLGSGEVVDPFPWGNKPDIPRAYGNFAGREVQSEGGRYLGNHVDNSVGIAKVGSYPANSNGLYDLAGNVSEWVHDYYQLNRMAGNTPDYMGPESELDHVVKGSNYKSASITMLYSQYRSFGNHKSDTTGFRIAKWIY